ncbi:MAG: ribosomal-processing cysteine protease Prp [Bacillota bacterium]|nr:ribosomal-processing cysteine protease Prp [Bacillota bacterium]
MEYKYIIILIVIILFFIIYLSLKKFDGNISVNEKQFSLDSYESKDGVKAFFFINKDGIIYKYIIYGRTNYSEVGTDIVASAISSLSINTTNSINNFAAVKVDFICKEVNSKPYLECSLKKFNTKQGKYEAVVLIKSLKQGLSDIEKEYGSKYLQVIENKDK